MDLSIVDVADGVFEIKATDGDLDLGGANITDIPSDIRIKGDLNLAYSKIHNLPDGLEVGLLNLSMCPNILSLPNNLTVNGYLYLQGTSITEIPKNARIETVIGLRKG